MNAAYRSHFWPSPFLDFPTARGLSRITTSSEQCNETQKSWLSVLISQYARKPSSISESHERYWTVLLFLAAENEHQLAETTRRAAMKRPAAITLQRAVLVRCKVSGNWYLARFEALLPPAIFFEHFQFQRNDVHGLKNAAPNSQEVADS